VKDPARLVLSLLLDPCRGSEVDHTLDRSVIFDGDAVIIIQAAAVKSTRVSSRTDTNANTTHLAV
jgi:hypothetical protein